MAPDDGLHFEALDIGPSALGLLLFVGMIYIVGSLRSEADGAQRRRRGGMVWGVLLIVLGCLAYSHPLGLIFLLGMGAAVWCVRSYRSTAGTISLPLRVVLVCFRIVTFFMLLLVISRPVWVWHEEQWLRPTLAVLIDESRSMEIRDVETALAGSLSARKEAVKAALREQTDRFEELAESFDLSWLAFDETVRPAEDASANKWEAKAEGAYTAIGGALAELADRADSTVLPLGAVLLVSDGADNFSGPDVALSAAGRLAERGVPILTAVVGSAEPLGETRSLFLEEMRMPEQADVGDSIPIEADLVCVGLARTPIRVGLYWDDLLVEERTLRPERSRQRLRLNYEHTTSVGGFHRAEVRAKPEDAFWKEPPASVSRFVRVVSNAVQVLYLDTKPQSEGAFLSRALAGEKRFNLTRVMGRLGTAGADEAGLATAEGWRGYQVVLLGYVTAEDLSDEQVQALRDLVQNQGAGLGLVGGVAGPANQSLSRTALADVLCVEAGSGEETVVETIHVVPTPEGLTHPVLAASVQDAASQPSTGSETDSAQLPSSQASAKDRLADPAFWRQLPALPPVSPAGPPKPAASVLATDQDGQPRIVAATVGRGRCLVVALSNTWRWAMHSEGGAAHHRRFWRQAAFWLANRRPQVQISVDRPAYDLADLASASGSVKIEAFVVDSLNGQTTVDAVLEATLIHPGGKSQAVSLQPGGDRWTQRIQPSETGDYELRLTARRGDELLGEAEARFVIHRVDRERRDPLANPAFLRMIAESTAAAGGRHAPLEMLGGTLDSLRGKDLRRRQVEVHRWDLADRWPWPPLAAIGGLLFLEWIVRKRSGLV